MVAKTVWNSHQLTDHRRGEATFVRETSHLYSKWRIDVGHNATGDDNSQTLLV
jgi:hypothetical protein